MRLMPLFEIDDMYRTMFDKLQLQYNKQGYSGSFCLFDVWGDIETDLDINKADHEGMANLRVWHSSCEIEKEQPERGMTTRIDLPRDRSAYRCDADSYSVYIEFPKYVQRFKLQDEYDYMMLIIALNKCLDSENPREKIEKGFADINPDLLNTSFTTSFTIESQLTVESYTKHGRFEDRLVWTKAQLTLKDQSISIWATHQDGFVSSSIEKDTVIKIDKDGWSKAFVDKGITGFEIWKFTSLDDFTAFLNFVSQLWPVSHNKVKQNSNRPYSEIRPIVYELERRQKVVLTCARQLIEDELYSAVEKIALPGTGLYTGAVEMFSKVGGAFSGYENLLSNSIRYAKNNITIGIEIQNNDLVISVSDDGCGFKISDIEKATLPFYKSSKEISTEHLGLGLNICKILSERHGGNIQISNNETGGACVTVRINYSES